MASDTQSRGRRDQRNPRNPRTISNQEQLEALIPGWQNYSLTSILTSPHFTGKNAYMMSPQFYKLMQDQLLQMEKQTGVSASIIANTPFSMLGNVGGAPPEPDNGDGAPPYPDNGSVPPWASSEAGVRFSEEQAMARLQAQLAAEQAAKMEELKAKRQQIFSEMLGTDPVRAVLFAMGLSGAVPGSTKEETASLPPLEGIQAYQRNTENALSQVLGKVEGGPKGPVQITGEGVTGLPSAIKAQNVFTQGAGAVGGPSTDVQKLLTSAFGVGHTQGAQQGAAGAQTGLNAEEFIRQIQDVTPRGVL